MVRCRLVVILQIHCPQAWWKRLILLKLTLVLPHRLIILCKLIQIQQSQQILLQVLKVEEELRLQLGNYMKLLERHFKITINPLFMYVIQITKYQYFHTGRVTGILRRMLVSLHLLLQLTLDALLQSINNQVIVL